MKLGVLIFLGVICIYIVIPKKTITLIHGGGWIFSDMAEICKCIGFSKGITNNWLKNYYSYNRNPNEILNRNDYCIGVKVKCLFTSTQVDLNTIFHYK